jgi:hypothetical protein
MAGRATNGWAILTDGGKVEHRAGTATTTALVIQGAASQSVNLIEVQSSAAAVLAAVTQAGLHKWAAANTQTTVGAVGGASAPPATPKRWLKVVDSDGTVLVIPAYNAV